MSDGSRILLLIVCLSLKGMDGKVTLMSWGWVLRQPETSVPAQLQLLLLAPRRDTWIHSRTPQGYRGAVHRRDELAWAEGATGELCALSMRSQSRLEVPGLGAGAPSLCLDLRSPIQLFSRGGSLEGEAEGLVQASSAHLLSRSMRHCLENTDDNDTCLRRRRDL